MTYPPGTTFVTNDGAVFTNLEESQVHADKLNEKALINKDLLTRLNRAKCELGWLKFWNFFQRRRLRREIQELEAKINK